MRILLILLLCGTVSACLVRSHSSESKRLREGKTELKTSKQANKEQEHRRKQAAAIIKRQCGSVLKRRAWMEDTSAPHTENFFFAETKSLTCTQHMTIGVEAALFMQAKSITCSETANGHLRFELSQSLSSSQIVEVDCQTEFIDLRSDGSIFTIATIEKNGSSDLVTVNSFGQWNGKVEKLSAGVSNEDLQTIEDSVEKAVDKGINLDARIKLIDIAAVTSLGTTAGLLSAPLVAAIVGTAAVPLAVTAAAGAAIGVAICATMQVVNQNRYGKAKKAFLPAALLVRKSMGVMLAKHNP